MVIYQKQHRLAHRQYCVPLSESRLTRFPPPSKKAFFPSSHIFRVNSKRIIKTLFSSKCSSINFRNSLHLERRDEKLSAPEHATEKVALLPGSEAAATERERRRQRKREKEGEEFAGGPLSAGGHSKLGSAPGRPRRGLILPAPQGVGAEEGSPGFAGDPGGGRRFGEGRLCRLPLGL